MNCEHVKKLFVDLLYFTYKCNHSVRMPFGLKFYIVAWMSKQPQWMAEWLLFLLSKRTQLFGQPVWYVTIEHSLLKALINSPLHPAHPVHPVESHEGPQDGHHGGLEVTHQGVGGVGANV